MSAREKPDTWEQWKARHPRWTRLTGIEWTLEWLVYWLKGLAIFEFLELAGKLSVAVVLILWISESGDRAKQKHYRAWELINSAQGSPGDGGRGDALRDLNEDHVSLADAPLAKAHLSKVELRGADLSGAYLFGAHLTRAYLADADLAEADLHEADLNRAYLVGANLSRADLFDADLSRADLTEANLNKVKFCNTTMPDGTKNNRDCTPASQPLPPSPNEVSSAPK